MKAVRVICCLSGLLSTTCLAASAQEVVHALKGTVVSVNAKAGTINLKTADGSEGYFKDLPDSQVEQSLTKDLRSEVVPADKFSSNGAQVVLLYEGAGDTRTAVAIRDLGSSPMSTTVGTVERWDRHTHTLTVKADGGGETSFRMDPKSLADTPGGVTQGMKFDPGKGDRVRVTSTVENGTPTALFVGQAV